MKLKSNHTVHVIGAGLAGCEAAYQLGKRNFDVVLHEMKPNRFSPAHTLPGPAELVCSNSLGSQAVGSAGGLLKAELRLLDSIILRSADQSKVPAGSALAVDREKMTVCVKQNLENLPNIRFESHEIDRIPDEQTIVASGPLTSDALAGAIENLVGERLFFFDATSPIVSTDSLDMEKIYAASRWDKGDPDYLNCPMDEEQYYAFIEAVLSADLVTPRDFEDFSVFEGCMPIEQLAKRGPLTLAFGPLRPVGLRHPVTGHKPFAVLQLRKEDVHGASYNLVGFQTRMTFPEQRRVFRMIPGLENAEFLRLGVMHRNTYIHSPRLLDAGLRLISKPTVQFAGQITGVEGYVESCAMGLLAALYQANPQMLPPPQGTILGGLHGYVTGFEGKDFQPMAANFGLVPPFEKKVPKKDKKRLFHERGVKAIEEWIEQNKIND